MPTILPTQRTLFWSLFFLLYNGQWREGVGGGRGVKCERVGSVFNHEFTPIGPHPNFILFNPLHCYKKFIHAAGDHHWSRQNIRLVRTLLKQNFSDKIHNISTKCTLKINKDLFVFQNNFIKSLRYKNISIVTDRYECRCRIYSNKLYISSYFHK